MQQAVVQQPQYAQPQFAQMVIGGQVQNVQVLGMPGAAAQQQQLIAGPGGIQVTQLEYVRLVWQ